MATRTSQWLLMHNIAWYSCHFLYLKPASEVFISAWALPGPPTSIASAASGVDAAAISMLSCGPRSIDNDE